MSAIFSSETPPLYRLRLDRVIDMLGGPTIGFCLHNPSLAGAETDDPTSTRGVGFVTAWRGSRLIYVNPWAGIATRPRELWAMDDPVGPDNDVHIAAAAREIRASGGFMVAAWGAVSPPMALRETALARLRHVDALIRETGCPMRCLGFTQGGSPRHPLYVPGGTEPVPFPPLGASA